MNKAIQGTISVLLLLVLLVSVIACDQLPQAKVTATPTLTTLPLPKAPTVPAEPTEIAGTRVQRYYHTVSNCSFLYPSNWVLKEKLSTSNESDAKVNITTENPGALISLYISNRPNEGLSDVVASQIGTYTKYAPNFVLVSKSSLVTTDYGSKIIFVDKHSAGVTVKELWLFAKVQDQVYKLVCNSSEGGFDYFYSDLFEGIIDSFRIVVR